MYVRPLETFKVNQDFPDFSGLLLILTANSHDDRPGEAEVVQPEALRRLGLPGADRRVRLVVDLHLVLFLVGDET